MNRYAREQCGLKRTEAVAERCTKASGRGASKMRLWVGGGQNTNDPEGLINETAEEATVSRAGRTRRPIYLPNNLP
jgi:hypothetical protein